MMRLDQKVEIGVQFKAVIGKPSFTNHHSCGRIGNMYTAGPQSMRKSWPERSG